MKFRLESLGRVVVEPIIQRRLRKAGNAEMVESLIGDDAQAGVGENLSRAGERARIRFATVRSRAR